MNFKENQRSGRTLKSIILKFSQFIVYICVPLLTLFDNLSGKDKNQDFFTVKGKE